MAHDSRRAGHRELGQIDDRLVGALAAQQLDRLRKQLAVVAFTRSRCRDIVQQLTGLAGAV
jgi:hypothetical protein